MLNEAIASAVEPVHAKGNTLPRTTSTTLRTSSLLAELSDATLERLAMVADWQVYAPTDVILQQSEESKSTHACSNTRSLSHRVHGSTLWARCLVGAAPGGSGALAAMAAIPQCSIRFRSR